MKSLNNWHPLSKRHLSQIGRRSPELRRQMYPIWGITWRPGDWNGSFLGRKYRTLGAATMMCQVSYPQSDGREAIGLFGIAARIEPTTATVSYDNVRLYHDFHRVPFPGARGKILDPSDSGRGGHGNGSWVRLALDVDRLRERAHTNHYRLPATPNLPQIYLGYGCKEVAKFVESVELRKRAAELLEVPWTGNTLSDLVSRKAEMAEGRMQAFAVLPAETRNELLRRAWESSLVSPTAADNNTGLWLLPQELATDVYGVVRVFEFFGDLIGVPVFNPARRMSGKVVANPAIALATSKGFDLVHDLDTLAHTAEGTPEFQAIEQRLIELVPKVRKAADVSYLISDQDVLNAICQPDQPVAVEPVLENLAERQQIETVRGALTAHISEATMDCDILEAIRNPHGPLLAAGLCQVQVLQRNVRVPLKDALCFSASSLGRDRVEATFWQDSPFSSQPRSPRSLPEVSVAA